MTHARLALREMAALLIGLSLAPAAGAQTFVRVTDPANPIVNEAFQSGGGCWVDLVGDGYLDLYVANGNLTNEPDALYRNDRAGGFRKVVGGNVVQDGGPSIGGTIGDFDNDGRPDIFVTNRNFWGNFLYRGLGDTLFAKVTTGRPVTDFGDSNSSSWVDIDNDGDLDLYVVNFQATDFFYRNDGAPTFTFTRVDTTRLSTGTEFSIPGAWADCNNDRLPDFFVGNAGTQSDYIYLNRGGLNFTKTTLVDGKATLGASWGDYDNDGYLDLFVAHYTNQKSTLYRNAGPPNFTLVPVDTSIVSNEIGKWVGSAFGDIDNDGDQDLYVANDGAAGALYLNAGPPGYGFGKVTTGPVATDVGNNFGAVWGDYDRDGQLDLFVANRLAQGNRLYRNQGNPNHWLTIRCAGTSSNRSGIGAHVTVYARINGVPRQQLREVTAQTGYNSSNLDQHFGLGNAARADSIRIEWPSGLTDTWRNVLVDRWMKLVEGGATSAVEPPPVADDAGLRLLPGAPNPFTQAVDLAFELPRPGRARVELFDVRGRRVRTLLEGVLPAGPHTVRLTAADDTPAGVYFVRLSTPDGVRARRVIRTR